MQLQPRARRCLCGIIAAPAIAVLTGPLLPLSAFATDLANGDGTSLTFAGVAAADGMRMQLVVPGAPGGNTVIDAGGPSAQAVATSAGTVRGFAAFPDPGETPRSLPTTGAGVLASNGFTLPFQPPDWPMVASSDYPGRPSQEVASGPLQLKATSSEAGAEGLATFGNPGAKDGGGGFSAAASVKKVTDGIVSRAVFRSDALAAGPVVLGRVVATAQMAMGSDGQLSPSSALEVVGAQIADTKFSITGDGFVFATNPVPVPIGEGLKNLNQALAPTGLAVQYSAERKTDNGVVAPVLEVTAMGQGGLQGTYTLAVGGVSASLQGAKTQEDDEADPVDASTTAATPGPSSDASGPVDPGPASGTPGGFLPGSPPVTAFPQGSDSLTPDRSSVVGSSPPGTSGDTTGTAAPDQPYGGEESSGSSTSSAPAAATAASPGLPPVGVVPASSSYRLGSVYGVIAAAALVSVLVVELVARIGVRRPWNS